MSDDIVVGLVDKSEAELERILLRKGSDSLLRENDALRARVAELEAQWAAVPWWALRECLANDEDIIEPHYLTVEAWLNANAPKAQEE